MKKIYGILMVMIIAFFTPLMVACNQTTPEAQVTLVEIDVADRELLLEVGDNYQLRYAVLPDEVSQDKKGVRFESDNPAITVSNSGLVTAISPTTTPATIKIFSVSNPNAYNASTCTVSVVAQKENLPTPTGLYFDVNTNELKWNKLNYANVNERYGLSLTPDGGEPEYYELTSNVFSNYDTGVHYTAKVKYLGGASTKYNDSEYSKTTTFEKLSTPELTLAPSQTVDGVGATTVDARSWTISFHTVTHAPILDTDNKLANYDIALTYSNVTVDVAANDLLLWQAAVQNAEITGNATTGWDVNITIPQDMSNNEYRVSVRAVGDITKEGDICDSATTYVDFDKLATPNNMVISGENVLTWNNVQNASYYKVVYRYKSNFGGTGEFEEMSTIIPAGSNVYYIPAEIMQNKSALYVYMYAMGDNLNVIDSTISPYCARSKLSKVTDLSLADRTASDDLELRWSAVSDAGTYRITVAQKGVTLYSYSQQAVQGNNTHTIPLNAVGSSGQALLVDGEYNIAVTAVPTSTVSHVASDPSDAITVTKLSLPNIRVREGKLIWDASNIADDTIKYDLSIRNDIRDWGIINLGSDIQEYSLTGGNYTGFDGEFDISLTTRGGEDKYIVDSNTDNITVTKMAVPSVLKINDGEIQNVDSAYCYRMIVKQQDQIGNYIDYDVQNFDSDGMDTVRTYLHHLDAGYAYSLSLVSTGLKNGGPNDYYIYSEVSDALVVRFLTNPSLGLVDGVLTITKPNDPYIFDGDTLREGYTLNYEIKVGTQTSITTIDAVDENQKVLNKVSFTLPELAGTTSIYARAVVTYTGADQDFEMLNSEFVGSGRVTVLGRVTGIKLESNVLSWDNISNASGYRITITNDQGEEMSDVAPQIVYTNRVTLDETKLGNTGNYSITIVAIGNRTSYINSYNSAPCRITRLGAPVPTVVDGKLVWSPVMDANGTVVSNYCLYWRNQATQITSSARIQGFETTFATLPAGTYDNIYVIALSEGLQNTLDTSVAVAQASGYGLVVTKLPEVDLNSVTVTESTIAWANSGTRTYSITLSRVHSNGARTVLVTDTAVESSLEYTYIVPNTYGGGEFRINVTTLGGANQINSTQVEMIVYLLEPVTATNITPDADDNNISKLYASTLDKSTLPGYSTLTGSGNLIELENIQYETRCYSSTYQTNDMIINTYTSDQLSNGVALINIYQTTNAEGDNYLAPGSLVNVSIRSQIDNALRIHDYNGTKCYILDSPYSTLYQFKLLSAPNVTVNDSGLLAWGNESATLSIQISFYEYNGTSISTTATLTKTFGRDVTTYDLADSELLAGKDYVVKTQSVGNGRDKQSSDIIQSTMLIHKLPTLVAGTDWWVQDGQIVWNTVTGANQYVVYYTPYAGKTYTYTTQQSGTATYSYLPNVNAGELDIQFQVKGKVTGDNVTINSVNFTRGYINGAISTATTVTKLGRVSLQVKDGELSWDTIRNNSGYEITINTDKIDFAGTGDDMQQYIMSENYNVTEDTNYNVKLFARGNTVTDFTQKTAFLNGEYSNDKTVLLYAPTTISVVDGQLVWDNLESHYDLNYQMQLVSDSGTEIKEFNKSKTTDLSSYAGLTFRSITVRFKGGNSSATDTRTVAVNSKYGDKLFNVHKLANIDTEGQRFASINTQGKVVWSYSNSIYNAAQPKTHITSYLKVDNNRSNTYVTQLDYSNNMTFDLSTSVSDLEVYGSYSYTPQVIMDIYAMGTADSASATGTLYLNSNLATFETYKFNDITDFYTDNISTNDGGTVHLNLSWDATTTAIITPEKRIYPDQIIMRYKKVEDASWSTKTFTGDDIQELCYTPQFFTAGNYQFELYAFASTCDILPSNISYANNGVESIPFLAFKEGNGSSANPFTIGTKEQLGFINYLKTSFFELTNSIDMGTQKVDTYGRNLTSIDNSNGRHKEFMGGLDGNGYRLYNITYNQCPYLALFRTIRGGLTSADDQFYGKSGVVLNLTLEVANLSCLLVTNDNATDKTQRALSNNYGLLVQNNFGYIYNCHVKASSTATMEMLMMNDVAFAGIAGTNSPDINNIGGVIEHCTNSINFSASTLTTITIQSVGYTFNESSKVAGIVAHNMGGTILGCQNYANITAGTVGGIAYYNNYIRYIEGEIDLESTPGDEDKQINSTITGCTNYGKIIAKNHIKHNVDIAEWLPTGGIVAINSNGNISHCHNAGQMQLTRADDTYTWRVMIGGIAGIIDYGNINNCYSYNAINDNPFDENLYDEVNETNGLFNTDITLVAADIACYVSINQFTVKNIAYHNHALTTYNGTLGKPSYTNPDGALRVETSTPLAMIIEDLNEDSNIDAPATDYLGNTVAWYVMDSTVAVAYGYAHITRVEGGSIIVTSTDGKEFNVVVLADTGYTTSGVVYQIGSATATANDIIITNNMGTLILDEIAHVIFTPTFTAIEYTITNNASSTINIYIGTELATTDKCHYDDLITIDIIEGESANNVYYTYMLDGETIRVDVPLVENVRSFHMPAQNITIYVE